MEKENLKTKQQLMITASQIRLAQYWSQSAFGIFVLCFIIILWSVGLLDFNFWIFNDGNKTLVFWISLIFGLITFVFGTITFIGSRYAKNDMLNLLSELESKDNQSSI